MQTIRVLKELRDALQKVAAKEGDGDLWNLIQSADRQIEELEYFPTIFQALEEAGAWRGLALSLEARFPALKSHPDPLMDGVLDIMSHVGFEYWTLYDLLREEFKCKSLIREEFKCKSLTGPGFPRP